MIVKSIKKSSVTDMQYISRNNNKLNTHTPKSSFQIRFLIAVLLLAFVLLLEKNDINLAGITPEDIHRVISADYETYLESWAATHSH